MKPHSQTRHAPHRRARGFTLLELMVVLVLLSVLSAVAAPGLSSFTSGQRVRALTFDLTSDLLFARSEALKRNATVTVTPRSSSWSLGWSITSGGTELLAREAVAESLVISNAPTSISFNAQGRVSSPTSAVRIGLKSSRSSNSDRCVELDLSGRARSKQAACS